MRWLLRITLVRVIVLLGLVLFFAFSPYDFSERARFDRDNITQKPSTPMEIALVWPFTNSNFCREGAEMAVREINNRGGVTIADKSGNLVKAPMILHFYDEYKYSNIDTLADQIIKNLNLSAVIGHSNPDNAIRSSIKYRDANLLYISPSVSDFRLTQYGFWSTVQTIPKDSEISQAMVTFALKRGWKKAAILYVRNTYGIAYDSLLRADIGEISARSIQDTNKVSNIELVFQDHYAEDEESFYDIISVLLKKKFDFVIVADSLIGKSRSRALALIYQLREMGVSQPILGTEELHSSTLWPVLGQKSNGIFAAAIFDLKSTASNEVARNYRLAFRKYYTNQPSMQASKVYEAIMLVAQAAERARSKLPLKLATMFRSTGNWNGLHGPGAYNFSQNGNIIGKNVTMEELKDGIFIPPEIPELFIICTNRVEKKLTPKRN